MPNLVISPRPARSSSCSSPTPVRPTRRSAPSRSRLSTPPAIPVPVTIKVPLYNIEIEVRPGSRASASTRPMRRSCLDSARRVGCRSPGPPRGRDHRRRSRRARRLEPARRLGANQLPGRQRPLLHDRRKVSEDTPAVLVLQAHLLGTSRRSRRTSAEVGASRASIAPPVTPANGVCALDPTLGTPPELRAFPFLAQPDCVPGLRSFNTRLIVHLCRDGGARRARSTQTPTLDGQGRSDGAVNSCRPLGLRAWLPDATQARHSRPARRADVERSAGRASRTPTF